MLVLSKSQKQNSTGGEGYGLLKGLGSPKFLKGTPK